MKVLVPYDGTLNAKDALRHAIKKVQSSKGELIVMGFFNREAMLFYEATPFAQDVVRQEISSYLNEANDIIKSEAKGLKFTIMQVEGDPERIIASTISKEGIDTLFCPTSFKAIVNKYLPALRQRGVSTSAEFEPEVAPAKA